MKRKIIAILAAVTVCAAFTGCGDNSTSGNEQSNSSTVEKSLDEKTSALLGAITLPEMVSVKSDTVKDRFGIEEADVSEVSAYICGSGAAPDEFGIFKATDANAAKRIEEALNKRIERQRKTYQDYTPGEMYKFDDCFVEVSGNVVVYAICEDNSKAKELLK